NPDLTLKDYFTPFNQACLAKKDLDLGSGSPLLLARDHELIGAGKEGRIYVINTNSMGHYASVTQACQKQSKKGYDHVLQESGPHAIGGFFSTPVSWNGYVYFSGVSDHLKAFRLNNRGLLSIRPASQSPEVFSYTGGCPVISSHKGQAGILWLIDPQGILRAYDATNLARELYNSGQRASRDSLAKYVKFSTPTV